jgi:hypothetical protein
MARSLTISAHRHPDTHRYFAEVSCKGKEGKRVVAEAYLQPDSLDRDEFPEFDHLVPPEVKGMRSEQSMRYLWRSVEPDATAFSLSILIE